MDRAEGDHPEESAGAGTLPRCAAAGVLAGLASLVPGVSGGTMILASGVYPQIVGAVAEITSGRFTATSITRLGTTLACAAVAIFAVAGPARDAFTTRPSLFFALFLGLTLGGAPLLWRMAGSRGVTFAVAGVIGALAVVIPVLAAPAGGAQAAGFETDAPALFGAGAVAAFAMVLPGISGSTLLLLMGMYLPFLNAVDGVSTALRSSPWDFGAVVASVIGVIPFFLGIALGIVVAARLVRYFLRTQQQATLGALCGLLVGATAGLWPFQTADRVPFEPTGGQIAVAVIAVLFGFACTLLLGGRTSKQDR